MTQTSDYAAQHYPLPVYNFRVTVAGMAMGFSQVSGIRIEYETKPYRHGLSFREGEQLARFRLDRYLPITLRKGTVRGYRELDAWLHREPAVPQPMEISLCDATGIPVVTWRIGRAIPVKLEAPTFEAGSNEVAIDSFEAMVASVSVVHH